MKTKVIVASLILCMMILLLAAPFAPPRSHAQARLGQLVSSGEAPTRQGSVQVQRVLPSATRKTPPDAQPRRVPKSPDRHVRLDPPVDPSVRPEDIRPMNGETTVRVIDPAKPTAPQAPGDITFYRNINTGLASAPVVGAVTLNGYIPIEPSVGANGRVVFYTTNSYAAVSGDSGQTFTYINPFDNFPADGANDPVNGGFGGDQYVYYERTRGLTFWLLQYNPDNVTNTQRLCIARTQADVLNNNWYFYDFTPASFGFTTPPAGASGFWLDFPDMAVSDNFLYLTSNVFQRVLPNPGNGCVGCPGVSTTSPCPVGCVNSMGNPTCTSSCSSVGAVIWRMPLNELAQGENLGFLSASDTTSTFRLTQGARGTMYWAAHNTTAQIRIYRWVENGNIAFDNVSHAAYNIGAMTATSPDGSNFAAFSDSRILGAYVANGVIGFMWNAAQGGGFAFPHVQWLRFNENNRSLINQIQIHNNNHAFLYPSVHPNDRGHLGGTMAWGGGAFFPNVLAWIADDFNQAQTVPFDNLTFAEGNAGPCDPAFDPIPGNLTLDCYNRWGDYFATRLNSPYGNTWSGSGFVLNDAGGVTRDPHYVWFGRERDTPPSSNTIYVNKTNTSGYEDGTSAHPYNTVREGNFACSAGDTLIIRAGNYNETGPFNRAAIVRNEGGIVRIGIP
jgi:hypothetical protein